MARFAIQQIRFNNVLRPGVSGWTFTPGNEINSDSLDSTIGETAHHRMAGAPVSELTTRDLNLLSALDGSTDFWYKACDGTNGLELIGGKASGPGFAGGSVHVSRKGARGALFGTGINWSRGSKAELSLRGMATSANGTTDPISTTLVALPNAPTPDFGWIVSALTLNAESISAVDSVAVTVDPKASFDYLAGLPEPTDILMAGVAGPAVWRLSASIGDCDLGSGSGAVSVVLRRLASGGGFSGAANSTLTITFNSNYTIEENLSGQSGASMSRSLLVHPRDNGVTKPVAWAFS